MKDKYGMPLPVEYILEKYIKQDLRMVIQKC